MPMPTASPGAAHRQGLTQSKVLSPSRLRAAWATRSMGPKAFGRLAEGVAAGLLAQQGWKLVGRNLKAAGAEADLLAWDGCSLVVVEVKARRALGYGWPQEAVDARKLQRLRRVALAYGARFKAAQLRVDLLALRWSPHGGWTEAHLHGI